MKICFNEFMQLVINTNHFNRSTLLLSYKVIYFKSGSGQVMIGSSVFKFTAGMYAVVTPNEIFEDIITSRTEEMICEFAIDENVKKIHSGVYYDNENIIQKQFEKIRKEYAVQDIYRKEFLDLLSQELYYLMLRSIGRISVKTTSIQDIIKYMDDYYYEDIKIELLAKKSGYTCRHFRSLFTEKTGLAPSEYLIKRRVEQAKSLLTMTSKSIVDISGACGFSSASQFAMFFKRYAGMTPSEFRSCTATA